MNDITIKVTTIEDISAIISFEKEARQTEPGVLYWDVDEKEYSAKLINLDIDHLENSKIIIAKQNQKVIGRCDIAIMLSLVNCEKIGYIDWIYTLKDYRNNGIGKKLLKGAEEYFKKNNVKSYFLETASNEEAQAFYQRQHNLQISQREIAKKKI